MKVLSFLPLLAAKLAMALAATVPTARQTVAEVTCTTRWSAINGLIEDLEERVRVADPTFLTSFYGSSSTRSCGGVTVQKFVDNILAVIATPDSWCSINGDGFGCLDCKGRLISTTVVTFEMLLETTFVVRTTRTTASELADTGGSPSARLSSLPTGRDLFPAT
ncbi:hypothetical protein C8R47DRAFT_1077671 [Mycena vitilis]|nr:hypothetical protein C8R47DRAFT_1077671 [Mycena vitilis]